MQIFPQVWVISQVLVGDRFYIITNLSSESENGNFYETYLIRYRKIIVRVEMGLKSNPLDPRSLETFSFPNTIIYQWFVNYTRIAILRWKISFATSARNFSSSSSRTNLFTWFEILWATCNFNWGFKIFFFFHLMCPLYSNKAREYLIRVLKAKNLILPTSSQRGIHFEEVNFSDDFQATINSLRMKVYLCTIVCWTFQKLFIPSKIWPPVIFSRGKEYESTCKLKFI